MKKNGLKLERVRKHPSCDSLPPNEDGTDLWLDRRGRDGWDQGSVNRWVASLFVSVKGNTPEVSNSDRF